MTAILIDQLSYHYPNGRQALQQISSRIEEGESVALVGANGAGKSTLLHHLNGLLSPQSGRVEIYGQQVRPATLTAVRRQVGMVFQNPDNQLLMSTVEEDVCLGPLNLGHSRSTALELALHALQQVGMEPQRHKAPFQLSAGEKRRVAIAGVLACQPRLLLLDEPGAGLDPWAKEQLIEVIGNCGATRVIASHDLELVRALCPRTLVLDHGRQRADEPTRTVLDQNFLRRFAPATDG